jgi:hypothetical protein
MGTGLMAAHYCRIQVLVYLSTIVMTFQGLKGLQRLLVITPRVAAGQLFHQKLNKKE